MFVIYDPLTLEINTITENYSGLTEEQQKHGFFVKSLPEAEVRPKQSPVYYVDPATETVRLEYRERELTDQERIQELEEIVSQLLLF